MWAKSLCPYTNDWKLSHYELGHRFLTSFRFVLKYTLQESCEVSCWCSVIFDHSHDLEYISTFHRGLIIFAPKIAPQLLMWCIGRVPVVPYFFLPCFKCLRQVLHLRNKVVLFWTWCPKICGSVFDEVLRRLPGASARIAPAECLKCVVRRTLKRDHYWRSLIVIAVIT